MIYLYSLGVYTVKGELYAKWNKQTQCYENERKNRERYHKIKYHFQRTESFRAI